jgi:Zn-dependent protease with chaperone function
VSGVEARHHDGRTSTARAVRVNLRRDDTGTVWLDLDSAEGHIAHRADACSFDMAVGHGPRRIELPGGGSLELTDGPAWDTMLAHQGLEGAERALARIEAKWPIAVVALVVAAAGLWAASTFGVPALVQRALPMIPAQLDAQVGDGGLQLLDRQLFEPTQIDEARRQQLRQAFAGVAHDLRERGSVRLEFRRGAEVGANAFALPDGIVIVTDELVALARHDDELRAVFAHEIGHVRHRHAMRALLAGSLQALLALAVLGDVSAATTLVAGVPATLAHSAYSRDLEREADLVARTWLAQAGVPQTRYDDLLRRLETESGAGRWTYLSTHPALDERLQRGPESTPR